MINSKMHVKIFNHIFDSAKIGIAVCNAPENIIEFVNPAFASIYGYETDDLVGTSMCRIFSSSYDECSLKKEPLVYCVTENSTFETTHLRKDGSSAYVSVDITVIKDQDGLVKQRIINVLDIHKKEKIKELEKAIEFMAYYDALTGVPNRALAQKKAIKILENAKIDQKQAAFLFLDLDGFKVINNTLGHSIGDSILKSVSLRLKQCMRESAIVSRQGDDEFLIILPEITGKNDVFKTIEKIFKQLEEPFCITTHTLHISASLGVSIYPDHGKTFEVLFKNADTAMYKAKEHGKNGYRMYTNKMNHNIVGTFQLHSDLKHALQRNEFILHYQPQVDVIENKVIGAEALIRWMHPQKGILPPMSFIPIAENSGLIIQIGAWVIEEVCRQTILWHEKGFKISVAVNISAMQFKRGNIENVIKQALEKSGLEPKYLELELTETIMMYDVESTLQTVHNLKLLGVKLSIDDFGTGYSSLSYLKRFAVDKLKIDQSFVREILNNKEDSVIVNTIIQMAKNLNLKTVAEGVENEEVLALIKQFGCDEVQGYHFAKPMNALDFDSYFRSFS